MSKAKQSISYSKLGGMRTDKPITDFEPHEAIQARNCRMSTTGRIVRRKGGSKYNPTQLAGAGKILALNQFNYGSGSAKFLEVSTTVMYTDDGSTASSIRTGMTTGKYGNFTTFMGYSIYSNGYDTLSKYDGTTLTNLSIAAVGSHPVIDSQTTGGALTLLGVYGYLVTFYNSTTGVESNPFTLSSALTITLTGSNNKILIKTIPTSADSQVNARRIYRTTAGGSIYNAQYVGVISDNSTTTFTDAVADTALGALIDLSNDAAPIFQKTVIHTNRLMGFKINSSTLYFSNTNRPWSFPQALLDLSLTAKEYTIDISDGDGDVITNIIPFYDYLLIFKGKSVYVMRGTGVEDSQGIPDYTVNKIEYMIGIGCANFRSALVVLNNCYFISSQGIYRTNAQTIEYVGAPMQGFFDPDSTTTSQKVNASKLTEACCEIDNRKPLNAIRFSMASGSSTVNDLTIVYDYSTDQWFYDTGYSAQSMCVKTLAGIDYLVRGDDLGYIWVENSQEGDGALITSTSTGSNTSTKLKDTSLNMTVDLYKGCYIEILSDTSIGERFRIASNTATEFTISGTWVTTPDTTSYYTVGGIDFYYQHKWDNYSNSDTTKRWQFVRPRFDNLGQFNLILYYLIDFEDPSSNNTTTITLTASTLWDINLWDVGLWDSPTINQNLQRPPAGRIHNWGSFGISHKHAGQSVKLNGFDKIFQEKGFGIR